MKQDSVVSREKKKTKKNKQDVKQKNDKKTEASEGWVIFCDFYEITHTVIKDCTVTIKSQDNKKMVRLNQKRQKKKTFFIFSKLIR